MRTRTDGASRARMTVLISAVILFSIAIGVSAASAQESSARRTPLQQSIENERIRFGSADGEVRRDAITKLGSMKHPDASRAALAGLKDPLAIIRATSAGAVLSLSAEESAQSLLPLLSDKDPFVRREAAYALGITRSSAAVPLLVQLLHSDKIDEVRGAAAVALGNIRNLASVAALIMVLNPQPTEGRQKKASKKGQNPFVLRSVARSLGQLGSIEAVPILLMALRDETADSDVRREAAVALGAIGDAAALPALRESSLSIDPHLASAAFEAIRKIERRTR
jgi:HEAT repeat protein